MYVDGLSECIITPVSQYIEKESRETYLDVVHYTRDYGEEINASKQTQ